MLKQAARLRVGLVFLLGILMFCSGAFAMDVVYRQDSRRDNRGDNRRDVREERPYYRSGRWYQHDSRGREIVVSALPVGVVIESLPPQHTTIIVENTRYYHDDRYYYRQAPNGGYIVVSQPVIVQHQVQSSYDRQGERDRSSRTEENRGQYH